MSLKTVDSHGYFKFSNVTVLISYHDKIDWKTYLPSFHLSPKNSPMQFGKEFLAWSDRIVDDSAEISDIRQQINNAGKVKFNFKFVACVQRTYVNRWVRS